jgi:hypothetical protein
MHNLIEAIVSTCKIHFTESNLKFRHKDFNQFVIDGDIISKAINIHGNERTEVNVLYWFDNFWIYIEISFVASESEFPKTFISISIFEGEAIEEKKNHLFRAEWDSFDNNVSHPQPHWHLHPYKHHYKIYENFEAFNELQNENGFEALIDNNANRIIDIKKMHFAMDGEWANNVGHIHSLSNKDALTNWMQGLLAHIKYQMSYALGD